MTVHSQREKKKHRQTASRTLEASLNNVYKKKAASNSSSRVTFLFAGGDQQERSRQCKMVTELLCLPFFSLLACRAGAWESASNLGPTAEKIKKDIA